jgi:hypothetical protein
MSGATDEDRIFSAARWHVSDRKAVKHAVPELRSRFNITTRQAVEAIRHANAAEQRGC